MTQFHSDYEEIFFKKSDVARVLENIDFPIDLDKQELGVSIVHNAKPVTHEAFSTDWMRQYAAKSGLRVHEAAWILGGAEPRDYEPQKTISGAEGKLQKNIGYFVDLVSSYDIQLINNGGYYNDNDHKTWLLDHDSIVEWASRTGVDWPLSKFMNQVTVPTGNNTNISTESVTRDEKTITKLEQSIKAQDEEIANLKNVVKSLEERISAVAKQIPLHPTRYMKIAIDVQHEHWQAPEENKPTQEYLIADIKEKHGISRAAASAIEAVACPIDRKRG